MDREWVEHELERTRDAVKGGHLVAVVKSLLEVVERLLSYVEVVEDRATEHEHLSEHIDG